MAKRIRNPIEVSIIYNNGITTAMLSYGLDCDDGLSMRKGFTPELTPPEPALIDQLITRAIEKINEHEGL